MASNPDSPAALVEEFPVEVPEAAEVPEEAEAGEAAEEQPRMRKRREPSKWLKNVAKRKRDSGEEYVSATTHKTMEARSVQAPCTCPKKCFERLGDEAVQLIFDAYYKMADHNAQSAYLLRMVGSQDVKSPGVGDESRRKATLEYSVRKAGEKVVVCKTAFLSIHNISDKRVLNVLKKAGDTGVAPTDRRGKEGTPHNKMPEDMRKLGHDHITSLPLCSSHYSRAKSVNRLYLPPTYSHQHCYHLFQLWCEEREVPAEKVMNFDAYRRLFSTFNIGTSPPKV